jgi:group II intron reverse transcriptase/maturase
MVTLRRVIHSAIDKVYNWGNLKRASSKVVSKRGAGGIDGMSVEKWQAKEDKQVGLLRKRLMEDSYRSKPVRRSYIAKAGKGGNKRALGIPVVRDRVCQQAVHNVLMPVFELHFHDSSHGFRPGRSTGSAARQVERLRRLGYRVVVDLDIKGFFDHVDHEILMRLVRRVVKDRRVLGLIRGWLKAGVLEEGKVRYATSGTPQGGVISPLLSNVYLTVLDNALEERGYRFVRYADDVVILCRSESQGQEALAHTREVLAKLKLELNEEKTRLSTFRGGFDFLGYHFGPGGRTVSSQSVRAFYAKVREATRRQQGDAPVEKVVNKLNPLLRGWGNYHLEGRNVGLFKALDRWVRNRLRAYVTKRWNVHHRRRPVLLNDELARMGLISLRRMISPSRPQLQLF